MMHKAWSSIEEVPYFFSRSYVKLQGHTALKSVKFDPNWVFPDCNSSFNSPMAMKCCTKLETAKERCPIVFQGHPSNFKVTWDKTSPILTQIGRFRTIGWSQLSNPSDLPCFNSFDISLGWYFLINEQSVWHYAKMVVHWSDNISPVNYQNYYVIKLQQLNKHIKYITSMLTSIYAWNVKCSHVVVMLITITVQLFIYQLI